MTPCQVAERASCLSLPGVRASLQARKLLLEKPYEMEAVGGRRASPVAPKWHAPATARLSKKVRCCLERLCGLHFGVPLTLGACYVFSR